MSSVCGIAHTGARISYLTLRAGTPVFSSDGKRLGVVQRVRADNATNLFGGIVVDTRLGPGGLRFVDAAQIAGIYERAVELTLDAREAERLPRPS
ncbi:MAG: hypothetical protein JWQ48_1726 [Conexibacter sp.]|nr:hypothetical protein [Conexibacter sp.]